MHDSSPSQPAGSEVDQPLFQAEVVDEKETSATPPTKGVVTRLKTELLHNWWAVLVLLFFVTGALGLPLLWISRAYGVWMKFVLTVIVLLYTAGLFWLLYLAIRMLYDHVQKTLGP